MTIRMHDHCCQSESHVTADNCEAASGGAPSNKGGKSVYLETFGCQMNELDSELVTGQLRALGYQFISDSDAADIVLYNTCSVREQAENKVLSRIGLITINKKEGRQVVLGVIGCMAEREGAGMMTKYPAIDLMCGPGELDRLPMLLDNVFKTQAVEASEKRFQEPFSLTTQRKRLQEPFSGRVALAGSKSRRSSTLAAADDNLEMLDLSRAFDPDHGNSGRGRSAYVRITRGCNKFCTYCVVPYTRGPEVHRPPDAIVDECKRLADAGVLEITLLGQTVNHYLYVHGSAITINGNEAPQIGPGLAAFRSSTFDPAHAGSDESHPGARKTRVGNFTGAVNGTHPRATTFADLLRRIHDEVPAIQRLRFVTSYPRDFSDDALHVIADSPRICPYLHVPAQSGSNRILGLMNRGYTVEQYLDFIDRARAIIPAERDLSIAGDIIVGFPTETDDDFEMTKNLLRRVRFKNNFIFKYSPRPGTTAIKRFSDDVPIDIKRRRNNELLALQAEISAEIHREYVGRTVEVFVEQIGQQTTARNGRVELGWAPKRVQMSGRTAGDLITVFDLPPETAPDDVLGRLVRVHVTDSRPLLLCGQLVEQPAAAV